ncbi:claudin-19-like isoform X1 [Seriola dumerili]|uniref:Claudin-19-like n=1 Tax=Seriola dumerili TaxID=41447 RepID=A0A3B4TC73_SERDU|nr:claudin-19-like isoform X1 [Seriola dumerili]
MSSSGMQLLGFFLTLAGLGATVAATFMVEWKQRLQGSTHYFYEGLWMSCSGNDITTCEIHESLLKLPVEVQATRAVMLLSIFLSTVALMVSTVGMKCTRFMDGRAESKSIAAMIGGIMFMVSGLLTIVITSWYVKMIIQTFHESNHLQSSEFGKAVFISWAGGLLTMAGGAFLGCRRCSRPESSESISSNHLLSTTNPKSNYV